MLAPTLRQQPGPHHPGISQGRGHTYAKVFKSLFYGSLVGHSETQLVFICLLTHCDSEGYVELPPSMIATMTGIPEAMVDSSLRDLEGPDPASRTADHEGRRIERVHEFGAWNVLNYGRYRAMRDEDDRKAQNREAQNRHRQPTSASVSHGQPSSSQAEAEAEADTDTKERKAVAHAPSARCLARCQERFPTVDIPTVEAKLLAFHERNPFKNLDMAMVNWCKKARDKGFDLLETRKEEPGWAPFQPSKLQ